MAAALAGRFRFAAGYCGDSAHPACGTWWWWWWLGRRQDGEEVLSKYPFIVLLEFGIGQSGKISEKVVGE
jgi:hypothetical protein